MTEFNLDVTYSKAWEGLMNCNPQEVSRKSGAQYSEQGNLYKLRYYKQELIVSLTEKKILDEKDSILDLRRSILTLHYLSTADGRNVGQDWISFKELPGGNIYIEPFKKRAIDPLLSNFGENLNLFNQSAQKLGGQNINIADSGYLLYPFPRIPVLTAVWSGDEEFPANATILFDSSASGYLPTEDYAFLASFLVYDLIKHINNVK